MDWKKNDLFQVKIEDMSDSGEGIGKVDGFIWFIKDAVIGDVVEAKVMKTKKSYGFARLMRVLEPSSWRVEPRCPVAQQCGGCQLQAMSYEAQLRFKENKVRNNLVRIGGLAGLALVDEDGRLREAECCGEEQSGCDGHKGEVRGKGEGVTRAEVSGAEASKEDASGVEASETEASGTDSLETEVAAAKLLKTIPMYPILGMDNPWRYRNKAQFPFGRDKDGRIITGFYAGRTHAIIESEDCLLGVEENRKVLECVRAYMEEFHIAPYEEETHTGLVRHVLIRKGFKTGEMMVCLVINGAVAELKAREVLVERLCGVFEEAGDRGKRGCVNKNQGGCSGGNASGAVGSLGGDDGGGSADGADRNHDDGDRTGSAGREARMVSISCSVNRERTNVIMGKEIVNLYGPGYITDYIGNVQYRISPLSFYQVNPVQTEKLYETALEYAGLTGDEVVWDLYCGIGTISLFLAQKAKKVYGVEIVPQAIEDARANAALNGMENVEFFVGKAEEVLPEQYEKNRVHADVIVVDPPRKGCDVVCLETIVRMGPERVVYVSCDSATLARDVKWLGERGYVVEKVRGVDQFPGSVHVETVALLVRKP